MIWMSSCARHGLPPCNGFCLFNSITTEMFLNRSSDWTHGRCATSSHDENPAGLGKFPSSGEWLHEIEHDGFQKLYGRPGMIQTERLSLAKPTCYRNFPT